MQKIKNFFYYEWKKLVAVACVIVLILVTVKQCNSKVVTDLGVLYISTQNPGDLTPLEDDIKNSSIVKDADGDGKTTIKTRTIPISNDEAINIEQQVYQQIQLEIVSGENLLFLINEETLISNATGFCFADIGDIAKKYNIPPQNCHAYDDGRIYAISIEGNSYLESLGINTENMFIAQRDYKPEDKDSTFNTNAKKIIEYILK